MFLHLSGRTFGGVFGPNGCKMEDLGGSYIYIYIYVYDCWGPAEKVKIVFPCKRELSFQGPRMSESQRFRICFRRVFKNAFQDTFFLRCWIDFGTSLG